MIDENQFFRDATKTICSTLQIQTSLKKCVSYLKDFMPVSSMSIVLFSSNLDYLEIVAYADANVGEKLYRKIHIPKDLRHHLKDNIPNHSCTLFRRNHNDSISPLIEYIESQEKGYAKHNEAIVLTINVEKQALGNLTLQVEENKNFTEEHLNYVKLLHDPFAIAIANALKHRELEVFNETLFDNNVYLQNQLFHKNQIIGHDFGLKYIMQSVYQVAKTNTPVLLLGETGVGKDVIANAIYSYSKRNGKPFIKVNCGSIPESLIDSELFGHEKGAFTGAIKQTKGFFERAHTGTIFLDEIGELPLNIQTKLLRVLQQKELTRVGGESPIKVDIRIIAATNRNLHHLVEEGGFRKDLFFRLNVFPIEIPPLRERKTDIPALVHHFIQLKKKELKTNKVFTITNEIMSALQNYSWPGNIRELENIIERSLITSKGNYLEIPYGLLNFKRERTSESTTSSQEIVQDLDSCIRKHIEKTLVLTKGKINGPNGAAELLNVHPNTLRNKMIKLSIPFKAKIINTRSQT